jgi:hypothetical protein
MHCWAVPAYPPREVGPRALTRGPTDGESG